MPQPDHRAGDFERERGRIRAAYQRRKVDLPADRWTPSDPSTAYFLSERRMAAARMLRRHGCFPDKGSEVLEVGYGAGGWLGDLISWGIPASRIHGIELDEQRAELARELVPGADLRTGDASTLPWANAFFDLLIISTVFTSVLDPEMRRRMAAESLRVLKPTGAVLWYDFRVNNPRNPDVRCVTAREMKTLFPGCKMTIRSITLAPPLARLVVPWSVLWADMLRALPFLRTHLLAVIVKNAP